jgi:hypothetical protein
MPLFVVIFKSCMSACAISLILTVYIYLFILKNLDVGVDSGMTILSMGPRLGDLLCLSNVVVSSWN